MGDAAGVDGLHRKKDHILGAPYLDRDRRPLDAVTGPCKSFTTP